MQRVRSGHPFPLGATWDGAGTNFAVFSEGAEGIVVCLFDASGAETDRLKLTERSSYVWHGYAPGVKPGQRYGLRVFGAYAPRDGYRFNPNKLVIDPYARAFDGKADYRAPLLGFDEGPGGDTPDLGDSAAGVPRCVVTDGSFDWGDDRPPLIPWHKTILYELHVKGFTRRHPAVPDPIRGTFAGLAAPAAIDHLTSLGVTTVELLPVQEAMDEIGIFRRGLTNYWGYSTLGFFAPDQRFASRPGDQVREFKAMVKALHAAKIEVVLDVVYNHTCEGDAKGPTVSFRGLDNKAYYRLEPGDPSRYVDFTGCGNTMNMLHPQTLKLVMDSLRYWATEMHVDGFRFDLASALGREAVHVDKLSSFFDIIHQDPVLSRVKLIAEPWDLGAGGYQVGNFPVLWAEWNGRFRDTVRRAWLKDAPRLSDLGYRLTGSSDLYGDDGRKPSASINFVTAHDGFTLRDLVSYEEKHNLANGEQNTDGTDDNASTNSGEEGESRDGRVLSRRARHMRNLMATLLLSQGVPMIRAGDETGRTQRGNNNAYCQDNEITWLDWTWTEEEKRLLRFTRALVALRGRSPAFHRRHFFRGERLPGKELKDITWLRPDGEEMTAADWSAPGGATLSMLLSGDGIDALDAEDEPIVGDTFFVVVHAGEEAINVKVPPSAHAGAHYEVTVDTGLWDVPSGGDPVAPGTMLSVEPLSLLVLRLVRS
jgi:isoamylase